VPRDQRTPSGRRKAAKLSAHPRLVSFSVAPTRRRPPLAHPLAHDSAVSTTASDAHRPLATISSVSRSIASLSNVRAALSTSILVFSSCIGRGPASSSVGPMAPARVRLALPAAALSPLQPVRLLPAAARPRRRPRAILTPIFAAGGEAGSSNGGPALVTPAPSQLIAPARRQSRPERSAHTALADAPAARAATSWACQAVVCGTPHTRARGRRWWYHLTLHPVYAQPHAVRTLRFANARVTAVDTTEPLRSLGLAE